VNRFQQTLCTFSNLDSATSDKYFQQFKIDLTKVASKAQPKAEDLELQSEYCLQNLREAIFQTETTQGKAKLDLKRLQNHLALLQDELDQQRNIYTIE